MSISSIVKSIQDIMRKDAGVDGDAQRLGQMAWLLFLRIFDEQELDLEAESTQYTPSIPAHLLWREWGASTVIDPVSKEEEANITGDVLLEFVNDTLFPALKELPATSTKNPRGFVVKQAMADSYNYMKNGNLLRAVIDKINELELESLDERHAFGDFYETLLKDLQSAGNAGEFYTPRSVTEFMVKMTDPKLGERIIDPACGTGGFLTCAIDHINKNYVKDDSQAYSVLQRQIHGVEKKPLPHLLCTTNMFLHGIEVPDQIVHDNTLARSRDSWKPKDRFDVVITNPPFGGMEEDGIEQNFHNDMQTRETADLFLQLIVHILKEKGRATIVLPDGTLFGEGVKNKIKEMLLRDCNLHTIIRLPNSVFAPYTSIKTNLLFLEKGQATQDIWYYEMQLPKGVKAYNKTKPMRVAEFDDCITWWGGEERKGRVENEQAWKVEFATLKTQALTQSKPHYDDAKSQKTVAGNLAHQIKEHKALLKIATTESKAEQEKKLKQLEKQREKALDAEKQSRAKGDAIYWPIYNLDISNPNIKEATLGNPDELLRKNTKLQKEIDQTLAALQNALNTALSQKDET